MRGPSQAALIAAVTALLSILIPPLGLLSAASVGLVTLRAGPRQGLIVCGMAAVGMAVLSWLALGSPLPAIGVLMMLWVPILGLATLLRMTRSLALAVQTAGMLGVLVLLGVTLGLGDPAVAWAGLLEPFREVLVRDGAISEEASAALFGELARWMTGAFAAALVAQLLFGLFIARWWQALLYNPGGFGEEFRALRLSSLLGVVTLLLLAVLPFIDGVGLAANLLLVLGLLMLMQGIAVVHQIRALKQGRPLWLVGFYGLLVLFMPQSLLLVASVGLVDLWADIRARIAARASQGPGGGGTAD
nr:hypothetical protein [Thiocapsa imhoffii]